jgi:hypothetical protein
MEKQTWVTKAGKKTGIRVRNRRIEKSNKRKIESKISNRKRLLERNPELSKKRPQFGQGEYIVK